MESIIVIVLFTLVMYFIYQRMKEKEQEDFEDRDN